MSRTRILLLSLLVLGGWTASARAELTWRPGEGWTDESGGDVSASSSHDQLDLAHKLEASGQRDDALKAYKSLLRRWPLSFFAPEAQFRMGKILEDEADFYNAFQAFQTMVSKYPSSNFFEEALGEQYRIANLYLAGEPQRIWKIPVGPSMDKTVVMYQRIIKNAPYGTYAPECQFKIGLARESQRRYTDAVDAYQSVLDNYPSSSVAANAQYQIGYAWMKAATSPDYDQSAAKKATDAFQDYLVRYPGSDKAAQAQDNIVKLGSKQTQGAFNIAQFYLKQHDSRAAFIYYNEVVREDPNSPQAQEAKKHIQELRPIVQAMPGGLGADGNPGIPPDAQTVASGPAAPTPAPAPTNGPAPMHTDNSPTTPDGRAAEADKPVESPSPGATTNAAPVSTPADGTPLPQ